MASQTNRLAENCGLYIYTLNMRQSTPVNHILRIYHICL